MNVGPDCHLCQRNRVRRSHGGGWVCPRCDLNEPEATQTSPAMFPNKRPPTSQT